MIPSDKEPMPAGIHAARGALDAPARAALLALGVALDSVVCVLRETGGRVTGAATVREAPFPGAADGTLLALELHGEARQRFRETMAATWRVLDEASAPGGPEGLVGFPEEADPRLEWDTPRTLLVGYGPDGREARLAPFRAPPPPVALGWPPADPPYRITPLAVADVSADDVVALWRRETQITAAEARRRVSEIALVATDLTGAVIGVSTCYLKVNAQLRMPLWHARVFVASAHRRDLTGLALAMGLRDQLEAAYVSGRDTRAPGFLFEIQHPGLKAVRDLVWPYLETVFIGEDERAQHLRLYFFEGARRP